MDWRGAGSNQQVPSQLRTRWQNVGDAFEEMLKCGTEQSTVEIAKLSPGIPKPNVVGIIIHKGRFRCFTSRKDNMKKFVIDITIRDSPQDIINISCWGQMQFVKFVDTFHIGHVVLVENVLVQSKPLDGSHEKFKPFTSSPYFLNLYESRGAIKPSTENDYFQDLLKLPIKTQNNFTIFDLINHCQELQGHHVSILALVKQIGKVMTVTTKKGQELKKREVKLFDDTAMELSLALWNNEWIYQASQWQPKNSIIYVSDVNVSYDNFRKRPIIMATDRTIITPHPKMREATLLARYAETIDFGHLIFNETDLEVDLDPISLECIKEEMCVRDIRDIRVHAGNEMYCALWVVLTHFNIDDPFSNLISQKCSYCHSTLLKERNSCDCNELNDLFAQDHMVPFYNLRICLTDDTGSLENCILSSKVTEKMMGEAANRFGGLNEQNLEQLKWKYLLERYKAIIQVIQSNDLDGTRNVRVLSLEMLQSDQLFEKFINFQRRYELGRH